jgi:serine phosphatase RsbU (regulator of sigma subunit)
MVINTLSPLRETLLDRRQKRELLPQLPFRVDRWEAAYTYEPAGQVSGDYCDLISVGNGDAHFIVGDVRRRIAAGHVLRGTILDEPASALERRVIVLCSDGVTETENPAGIDYGHQRVIEQVRGARDPLPDVLLGRCLDDLYGFRGGASQRDDITLMLLRRSA